MKVPIEFTEEYVEENSPDDQQIYRDFLRSGEPFRSIFKNNPWLMPPDIKNHLNGVQVCTGIPPLAGNMIIGRNLIYPKLPKTLNK